MKQEFYSNGKLLITGEYLVLDGANALAFPTKFGQSMLVNNINQPNIDWQSFDNKGNLWLQHNFPIIEIEQPQKKLDFDKNRLFSILREAKKLNPNFLNTNKGYQIITHLDFPKNWGLGSSSTLINNIAKWANVDPFKLLEATFGGSGYDIAAAQYNSPIIFSNNNNKTIEQNIKWDFTNELFFVHLNKKQNSREGISKYKKNKKEATLPIIQINEITSKICNCNTLIEFEILIDKHEQIISEIIQQKPIKELLFNDYIGSIKSLGAWGGDFILATGNQKNWNYFKGKGFNTILSFKEMIL